MPILNPERDDLKAMRGLHLWHSGMSNCSQRCRITLAELGQDFESHLVNPQKGEHATEDYLAINPKGVVPALLHDGRVIIESTDIIDYLDATFNEGTLRPAHLEAAIGEALSHADEAQLALKYCSFEFFFRHGPRASDEDFDRLMAGLANDTMRAFWREYRNGFPRERIHDMVGRAHADFARRDEILKDGREWMAGDTFSLADIAWMPNLHRFDILGWPVEQYTHLMRWFEAAAARESYKTALEGWEPLPLMEKVAVALAERKANGDGIDSYGPLAA
ncbi:MAG: glutathione S-transferase family protein [Pseudomonadota bacterium]